MKKIQLALVAVALLIGCGCTPGVGSSHNYVVKVDYNNSFSGSIMVVKDGKSEQRSVESSGPTHYDEQGQMVSVSFQKKSGFGTMTVEILRDGQSVAKNSTSAEYGVVTVAGR